ncbi:MAG: GNAT family N-acetyltransferase [Acidimicrobiia bacterium]
MAVRRRVRAGHAPGGGRPSPRRLAAGRRAHPLPAGDLRPSRQLAFLRNDRCSGSTPVPEADRDGEPLTEGFVEAFGVMPSIRRAGVGSALQATAIEYCRPAGCHQMRSRSPITSVENHALKITAGYVIKPAVGHSVRPDTGTGRPRTTEACHKPRRPRPRPHPLQHILAGFRSSPVRVSRSTRRSGGEHDGRCSLSG